MASCLELTGMYRVVSFREFDLQHCCLHFTRKDGLGHLCREITPVIFFCWRAAIVTLQASTQRDKNHLDPPVF